MSISTAARQVRLPVPGRTAFFLCDIQERFRPLIWNFPHVINTASKMISAAQILEVPVIATEQHPKAFGPTVPELNINHIQLCVPKTKFSMWTPEVEDFVVNKVKAKSAVLFGIESHVCVLQTALDLLRNDIDVFLLADGTSSIHAGERKIAFQRLRDAGVTITTSESVLFQLMVDAKHEKFKQISSLVKEMKDKTSTAVDEMTANL